MSVVTKHTFYPVTPLKQADPGWCHGMDRDTGLKVTPGATISLAFW